MGWPELESPARFGYSSEGEAELCHPEGALSNTVLLSQCSHYIKILFISFNSCQIEN